MSEETKMELKTPDSVAQWLTSPAITWESRACGYIAFLRSVIRSGEQLSSEDDDMIDKFVSEIVWNKVKAISGKDIYKLNPQEFLTAAEQEKSQWLPACDQDHLELLAFFEEACTRLKRANEVRVMEVWDKRVLEENAELKDLLRWCRSEADFAHCDESTLARIDEIIKVEL